MNNYPVQRPNASQRTAQLTIDGLIATNISRSPLIYAGGKKFARAQIFAAFPPLMDNLVSPFIGGGAVELAAASRGIRVHGADLFEPVVNFWQRALRNPNHIADLAEEDLPITRATFARYIAQWQAMTDPDARASVYWLLNRSSTMGEAFKLSSYAEAFAHAKTPSALHALRNLYAPTLTVVHAAWRATLDAHPNTPAFLDPPYPDKPQSYHTPAFDHEALRDYLEGRNTHWVLTYCDTEPIRHLYRWAHIERAEWHRGGFGKRQRANEVVITPKRC